MFFPHQMECVRLVRYRWQRGAGAEVKELEVPQIMVPVLTLALRLTGACLHLLLTVIIIIIGKLNAACLKMVSRNRCMKLVSMLLLMSSFLLNIILTCVYSGCK